MANFALRTILAVGALGALAGCGGGSSSTPAPAKTYTIGGTVAGLIAGTSVSLSDNGTDSLVVGANGAFTFAAAIAANGTYAVTVSNPALAQNCSVANGSGSGLAANVTNVAITCTAAQQYAYVLNNGLNAISYYRIGSTGLLENPSGVTDVATGVSPQSIAVDPTRRYVYVPNFGDNTVSQYVIQIDGTLKANTPASVATCNGPDGLAIDPSGKNAYVICKTDQTVVQLKIGADGGLVASAAAPVAIGIYPWLIAVTPDGKRVYITAHGSSVAGTTIDQYAVATDGSLSPLSPATATTAAYPTGFAIDAAGTHLYVANAGANVLSQYTIASDGQLTSLTPATVSGGSVPDFVAIHPSGHFAYAPDFNDGTTAVGAVSQYSIGSDGKLTALPGAAPATGFGPDWMSFDALGRYGYVLNISFGTVSEYVVNSDGTLMLQVEALLHGPNGSPYAMAIAY